MEAADYKFLLFIAIIVLARYFFGNHIDMFKKENPMVVIVGIIVGFLLIYYSCQEKETPLNTLKLYTYPEEVRSLDQILFLSEFMTLAPSNYQRI